MKKASERYALAANLDSSLLLMDSALRNAGKLAIMTSLENALNSAIQAMAQTIMMIINASFAHLTDATNATSMSMKATGLSSVMNVKMDSI